MTKAVAPRCPVCKGIGYTRATAPEITKHPHPKKPGRWQLETLKQGSGCPKCHGTGEAVKEAA